MFLFKKAVKAWMQGRPIWIYLSAVKNGETVTSYSEQEYWGSPVWTRLTNGTYDWYCDPDYACDCDDD